MAKPEPCVVCWISNGNAHVCDQYGDIMPEFSGRQDETVAKLKAAGWSVRSLSQSGTRLTKNQLDFLWEHRHGVKQDA